MYSPRHVISFVVVLVAARGQILVGTLKEAGGGGGLKSRTARRLATSGRTSCSYVQGAGEVALQTAYTVTGIPDADLTTIIQPVGAPAVGVGMLEVIFTLAVFGVE
jgi:hypothetical protein